MTVAAKPATISYDEDGVSVLFAVPFRFKEASDLVVERLIGGSVMVLQLGTDYGVTGGATDAGGTLTRTAATNGATLRITRDTARAQPMTYATGDRFPAASHEDALDRQMLIAQEQDAQQADMTARALMVPPGSVQPDLVAADFDAPMKILTLDPVSRTVKPADARAFAGPPGVGGNTFLTLQQLRALDPTEYQSATLADGINAPVNYAYVAGNFTGRADDVSVVRLDLVPLAVGALVRQEAQGVSYQAQEAGAVTTSLFAKVSEGPISVFDLLSEADKRSIKLKEFDVARAARIRAAINQTFYNASPRPGADYGRAVYFPSGGYPVDQTLLYGDQQTNGQARHPAGMYGDSVGAVEIRAIAGFNGTLLQAWSVAGAEVHSFTLDTRGTPAMALDMEWKQGPGPSTNNKLEFIYVRGGTAAKHVSLRNLNDTFPKKLIVVATDPSQCCIDAFQPGGLTILNECEWVNGYLNIGCQNGAVVACWGFGVQFAAGALNQVEIPYGYLYPNSAHGAVLWSESKAVGQSVKALGGAGTQLIPVLENGYRVPALMDLNAYSSIAWDRLTIPGTPGANVALFSATSRRDSFSNVLVTIDGGSKTGPLTLNEPVGFDIQTNGFIDDDTAQAITKNRSGTFAPAIVGSGSPGTANYSTQTGRWIRVGNIVRFDLRLTWSGHTGSGPASIPNVPFGQVPGVDASFSIGAASGFSPAPMYASMGTNAIVLLAGTGAVNVPSSGDLQISGTYQVAA